ncbi:hypothetical protein IWW34DRAFT_711732 [Fusarium oxysporum f. sp. albedinis]|nr:hypothetical protein IWW34DRAFT_711732 [Fusarium oxysporum f. sp. albedinis]
MAGLPLRLAGRTDVVPQNNGFTVPALDDSGMSTASGLEQTSYGLDLVHMQYISIGTLTIAGVRFSILMFFPTGDTQLTRRGDTVPYLQNRRPLFQAHNLKNTFASQSHGESLDLSRDIVLAGLDVS